MTNAAEIEDTQDETFDDTLTISDVIHSRVNFRSMEKSGFKIPEGSEIVMPCVTAETPGFRDEGEFLFGCAQVQNWSERGVFNAEDRKEFMPAIVAYCDKNELSSDAVAEIAGIRTLYFNDIFEEQKEVMDYALYRATKTGNSLNDGRAKSALFTINIIDVASDAKRGYIERLQIMKNAYTLFDERDELIDAHYATLETKFAEKYNHTA